MKKSRCIRLMAAAIVLVFLFSIDTTAQDRRRAEPAFPIGAGEKMLVIATSSTSVVGSLSPFSYTRTSLGIRQIQLSLPVGTTIKRILGDFVDQSGSENMTIRLIRVNNSDLTSYIELRSFDTSGISSSSATDFKQIVANPMTHTTLQGWSYWVLIEFPGGTGANELVSGVIKIIYEP